ncbi:hypothetical protein A0H81_11308 [Grifola frondosa]|uniref:Uncharacterized protein n=1 Tax=Grifola frondosa TaxID=5627 RepID=A0A1C7LVX8_GRIFR|nr:hypothetical protein A0H81_11308 [Grifola frondosa]
MRSSSPNGLFQERAICSLSFDVSFVTFRDVSFTVQYTSVPSQSDPQMSWSAALGLFRAHHMIEGTRRSPGMLGHAGDRMDAPQLSVQEQLSQLATLLRQTGDNIAESKKVMDERRDVEAARRDRNERHCRGLHGKLAAIFAEDENERLRRIQRASTGAGPGPPRNGANDDIVSIRWSLDGARRHEKTAKDSSLQCGADSK